MSRRAFAVDPAERAEVERRTDESFSAAWPSPSPADTPETHTLLD